jgi:head-tail adaptor
MQQETFGTQFKVFARGDADIKADDRIVYGGKTYEVVDTPLDPSFIGHHLEVEVKLVPKVV